VPRLDAVDERVAWVGGSAGEVLRTTDGGRSWRLAFVNDDPNAFYDCMDFTPAAGVGSR
jgi:photosystem II stability/assembly factor-like uncharacterized protein